MVVQAFNLRAAPREIGHDGRMEPWSLTPIATVRSPFQEKFGIPRQSGLTQVQAQLHLHPDTVEPSALQGMEACSHLWLIFGFHGIKAPSKAASVRPPRLGGNERRGVYSTRSPFRPNRLGLSLVQLIRVDALVMHIQGADLLDQTPIFDIKPFVSYCDTPEQAHHWAQRAPSPVDVTASDRLARQLEATPTLTPLWQEIQDYLRWDPRPAYRSLPDPRLYSQRYGDHEIRFSREETGFVVQAIEAVTPEDRQ